VAERVHIERHEAHPETPRDTHNPIDVDPATCISCVVCDQVCPGDIIIAPDPSTNELPIIKYPDECWYCGLCQQACPTDAITVIFPEWMLDSTTPVASLLGVLPEGFDPLMTPSGRAAVVAGGTDGRVLSALQGPDGTASSDEVAQHPSGR